MLDAPTKKKYASISGAEASTTPNTCIYPFRGGSFLRLPEAYFRFKGLISHLPEVYLRFEGLLIHVIGSINGYTSTSFRRFRAVSTWASAPRSGSRLPDKAKSAPRSRESTFLRCQKPTERKRVVCTYDQFANRRSKRGLVLLFARRPVLRRRPYLSDRKPEKPAPITPPIMMELMTRPCRAGLSAYLSCRKSMAPEMDTVS